MSETRYSPSFPFSLWLPLSLSLSPLTSPSHYHRVENVRGFSLLFVGLSRLPLTLSPRCPQLLSGDADSNRAERESHKVTERNEQIKQTFRLMREILREYQHFRLSGDSPWVPAHPPKSGCCVTVDNGRNDFPHHWCVHECACGSQFSISYCTSDGE